MRPLIRPEIAAWLSRWSEVLVAGAIALAGLWLTLRGGWFFAALGLAMLLVGAVGIWMIRPAASLPVVAGEIFGEAGGAGR